MPKKAFSNIILIIIAVAVVVGVGGYMLGRELNAPTSELTYTPEPTSGPSITPTPSENIGDNIKYINQPGLFSLVLPTGYKYCEDNFCQDDGIVGNGFYFSRFPLETGIIKNTLEIDFAKNSLDMSAIEFAKRSISLARQYSVYNKNAYSQEKEVVFAGEKAYEFVATGAFEEFGKKTTGQGWENAPEFYKKAGEGRTLGSPIKVLYLDHNGLIYRILYSPDYATTKGIIESFKFKK